MRVSSPRRRNTSSTTMLSYWTRVLTWIGIALLTASSLFRAINMMLLSTSVSITRDNTATVTSLSLPTTNRQSEEPPSNTSSASSTIPDRTRQQQETQQRQLSKPLCDECLEVIRKAPLVNISNYIDMRTTNRDPHLGALDEHGHTYVYNVTAVCQQPPTAAATTTQGLYQDAPPDQLKWDCNSRDDTFRMLDERIQVQDYSASETKQQQQQQQQPRRRPVRILCLVYTVSLNHHTNLKMALDTWGRHCDGFVAGSNLTEPSVGAVNIPHLYAESKQNLWQKVRTLFAYAYDHYYFDFDWFVMGGDDRYQIMDNLRLYLESDEIRTAANGGEYLPDDDDSDMQVPLYLGNRLPYRGDPNDLYNNGGPGYLLNKAALRLLVTQVFPWQYQTDLSYSEDLLLGRSLRQVGVYPYPTHDDLDGERFQHYPPGFTYSITGPHPSNEWYRTANMSFHYGAKYSSPHAVAFHYLKPPLMRRVHVLLQGLCPDDTANDTVDAIR